MIKLVSNLPNLLFFSHFNTFQCSSIVNQTQLLNCTGISIKRNRSKSNSIHGLFYLYTLSTFLVNYTSRWKLSDLFTLSQTKLAILKLIGWQRHAPSACSIPFWYWTPMLWAIESWKKKNYPLATIRWPYHGLKFRAHQVHLFFWSWLLTNLWVFYGITSSYQVNLL